MKKFVHLHNHSHYSLLQGLPKIPELIKMAVEDKQESIALTDYGSMYGTIHFYKEAKKQGIKPIIGLDAYMAFREMEKKDHGIDNKRYPFTLLVKNEKGYKNLMKLVTQSYIKGFYYRPRMDKNLLSHYSDGLICLSGPIFGEIGQSLLTKNFTKAESLVKKYQDIFGKENFYLEIMFNKHIEGLKEINEDYRMLSKKTGAPLVATQNIHYLNPEDREAFDTLLGISTTGNKIGSNFMQGDFHFATQAEMLEKFSDFPEAIENTIKIAEQCNLEIDIDSWYFPEIEIPKNETYDSYLRRLTYEGIKKRKMEETPELQERIEYELDIIKSKGYSSYFLIMSDLVYAAKKMGIYTNTRGSAAGSLVSYLNFITKVNPIELNLPFERFMNPGRKGIPDIDLDISDIRRDDLIDYARNKYGKKAVAQIGTFGTMAARGAVRDVARALDYPYELGDKIAKLIPLGSQGFPMTIKRALDDEEELKELYEKDTDVKKIIKLAQKIEGCARHISVHAAGVVISPSRVDDFCPVQMDPKGGKIITQYDMYTGDRDGVVNMPKFDLLGIRNLSILANAVELVKKIQKKEIDLNHIQIDDKKVFSLLAKGSTMGVFQMGSSGMTKYITDLKPTNIHEINAMIALYRPGPMEFIPEYIKRKRNPELVKYLDPRMEKILKPTYGILIYQDDVMMIAVELAGFSWGDADKLRKAIGKKIPEMMEQQREKLINGCIDNGMKKNIAEELWHQIETFAAYGFNKAHAASYGRITYETAYMKANFPLEYMTAMLSAESGDTDKIAEIIHTCESMNIDVLPPDINECFGGFTVIQKIEKSEKGAIRFGFYTIKNLGEAISNAIVEERKRAGKFASLEGFLNRMRHKNFNKKSLEALIMAGALDSFGERGKLLYNIESMLIYNKSVRNMHSDQVSLFGENTSHITLRESEKIPLKEKLSMEKEILGVYVSGHPLDPFKKKFESAKANIQKIHNGEIKNEQKIIIGGIIEEIKEINTKKGDKMAFLKLRDFTSSIEAVVFPRIYKKNYEIIELDTIVAVQATVSIRDEKKSIIIQGFKKLEK